MPSIKGTASVSDARARSKELKTTKFPKIFSVPVAMDKLNRHVFSQWIEHEVASILGFEDEIVSSTAINLFLPEKEGEASSSAPDPRRAQLDLAGFLGDEESAKFAKELWTLMIEASENGIGIPKTLLEEKKKELAELKKKAMADKVAKDPHFVAQRPQQQQLPHPRIDQFVVEAARRADRARRAMGVEGGRVNRWGNGQQAPTGLEPVPVSPPHQRVQDREHGSPFANGGTKQSTFEGNDQKFPPADMEGPAVDQFGRAIPPLHNNHTHKSWDVHQRYAQNNDRNVPPTRSYAEARGGRRGSSRSRSRDSTGRGPVGGAVPERIRSYDARGSREDERRRFDHDRRRFGGGDRQGYHDYNYGRHNDRHHSHRENHDRDYRRERLYDEERELEELDRRLVLLRKQSAKRKDNNPQLGKEIEDTKDRIYELERRRRKYERARERDDDTHRRRNDRSPPNMDSRRRRSDSRSPSPKRRQGGRAHDDSSGSDGSSPSARSRRSYSDGDSNNDTGRSESQSRSESSSPSRSRSRSPSDNSRRGKRGKDMKDAGDHHGPGRDKGGMDARDRSGRGRSRSPKR